MPKRSGLSSGVTVACGTSFGFRVQTHAPRTKRIKLNKSAKELADKKREEQAQIASKYITIHLLTFKSNVLIALSFQERQDLLVYHENDVDMSDPVWVDEDAFVQPPPGEEGFFSSHAGGEVQLQDLFLDTLAEG